MWVFCGQICHHLHDDHGDGGGDYGADEDLTNTL